MHNGIRYTDIGITKNLSGDGKDRFIRIWDNLKVEVYVGSSAREIS